MTDSTTRCGSRVAPCGVAVDADITLGRRLLRRRRSAVVLGAVSVVVVAALASGVAGADDERTDRTSVATPPQSDDDVLTACRNGNRDRAATDATRAVFGPGDPVIKAESRNEHRTVLALEAADGQHWAWCWVTLQGAGVPLRHGGVRRHPDHSQVDVLLRAGLRSRRR